MVTQNGVLVSVPLTTGAVAQIQDNMDYVATRAFHVVTAPTLTGTYKYWDKNDLARYEAELRKPGASYKRVDLDLAEKAYQCLNYGLKTGIAQENSAELGGNPLAVAAEYLLDQGYQTLETAMFNTFLKTGVFENDIAVGDNWDTTAGNPIKDIRNAQKVGRAAGRKPLNSMVLSEDVFEVLIQNEEILDRMPTNEMRILTQEQQLAAVFGLANVYVSKASNITVNEGAATGDDPTTYGTGKCLLFHKSAGNPVQNANAGLIIVRNYGQGITGSNGMGITSPYFDEDTDSEIIKLKLAFDMVVPAPSCGVLLHSMI